MSTNNLAEALTNCRVTQDASKLLKLLINIRKDVDWPKNKDNINRVREAGILKEVVLCLANSKKAVIDLCLSILGNCCLDSKCSRDLVSQHNILPNLNQVLKKYPKEDSINGRVFRIIGNLCQHRDQWGSVIISKKPQIVIHIVNFLKDVAIIEDDDKTSEASVIMAIRALRELVNRTTLHPLVTTYEVMKVIGMILIKYGAIWQETKKCENVIVNIIKLLQEYSRHKFYTAITEMKNTNMGDSITYLSKVLMVAPRQVIKIIMNFLNISQLNSDLPIPKIFDSFIEVLKNDLLIKEFNGTCEECIKCICLLLEHPGNRNNERCGDSIPLLVNILNDLTLESRNKVECCILILSTLNKCRYNDALILEQIKNNILQVLIEKLKLIIGAALPLTIPHKSDKKRKDASPSAKKDRKNDDDDVSSSASSEDGNISSQRAMRDWSPVSSCDSELAMSWTSGLSPQSSPRSQNFAFSESDSDDYSPVCSESDPSELQDDPNHLEIDKYSENNFEDDENMPTFIDYDSSSRTHAKQRLLIEIVELLKTYIKLKPNIPQLGEPELLLLLTKCCIHFDFSHSAAFLDVLDAIYRILEIHDYLLPLMQTNFIPAIYDLTQLQHGTWCSKCCHLQWISSSILKKMSKAAESGAGKGDIAHKLLRGDNSIKQQLVLVIPYIVKNKSILVKLMLNCGGLEVLIKLLQDESDLQEKSIKVLCVLASKKLCIPNPKNIKSSYKISVIDQDPPNISQIVTFKLDDGSLLEADRLLLSQNSDFFSRMLNGDFKESTEDQISLHNVINKSFKFLLHLIKCDINKSEPVEIDLDLNTHLDVIALCDRFLMSDFCVYLTDCVEKYRLSSDTIPTIYQWSMESKTNLLRIECIAFALVANILDSDRLKMFQELFLLGYTDELVEDIRTLLVRYMTLSQHQMHESRSRKRKRSRQCRVYLGF